MAGQQAPWRAQILGFAAESLHFAVAEGQGMGGPGNPLCKKSLAGILLGIFK
jgi:hypothetical protein